jgi:diguanylate cyclase (GGDEF)-like protein
MGTTKRKNKVLLMVADKLLQKFVASELKKMNASVILGDENVVQRVFDEVPHLIVVDELFHEGQGEELAHAIKEDMVLRYIPIILIAREAHIIVRSEHTKIDCYLSDDTVKKTFSKHAKAILLENHNELDINPLTSLPGVRSSVLRIESAIRSRKSFAVCCIDLSNLAAFNMAYGDARGDEVIVRLSHIIQDTLRYQGTKDSFVGHLGGDDLIVVVPSDHAESVSEAIIQSYDAVIHGFYDPKDRDQGYLVQASKEGVLTQYPIMSVSIAIVQNDRKPNYLMPQISKIAGEMKKYMKALPGSCYIKYQESLKSGKKKDAGPSSLEVRFPSKMKSINITAYSEDSERRASFFKTLLKNRSIRSLYQPIIELKTKRIVGYEALSRAISEYPNDEATLLFSAARDAGLVKELDVLCVETALKTAQGMPPDKKLFLNINHETLLDSKMMKQLFRQRGNISFKNIGIEVTEQSILRSFDKVRDALLELKEQGVAVAIDDLGGGAVSLRDVAILKPDYIKFDRSLIRQIDVSTTKQQIVLSMILFAKGINALTTAEGIETKEEYEAVLACGANLGQGYYFARPGPAFPKISI